MKITITESGGSPVTLADHGRLGPNGLTLDRQYTKQIQRFLRGNSARAVDRGNVLLVLSFEVRIEHVSLTAAQAYWFDRHLTLPRSGSVVLEFSDQVTSRAMPESVVQLQMAPPIGVLTTERITIESGAAYSALKDYDNPGNPIFDSNLNPTYALTEITT